MGNYVDPFAGSLAVLLARPGAPATWGIETVNDLDGLIENFWRSVQRDPDAVAHHADWPINEAALHARHLWLVGQRERVTARLMADDAWYDAKAAGWWVWGICSWIGSGWCSGDGPWTAERFTAESDGHPRAAPNGGEPGVTRKRPHLGDAGRGIHRGRPHLSSGMGIHRQLPAGASTEPGECARWSLHLRDMMRALADRLRRVRVCCGDWSRVLGPSPTTKLGMTAVFLDPPYSFAERKNALYAVDNDVSGAVREWAIAHGSDPLLRIALCGYDTEHAMPPEWEAMPWKAHGGYGVLAAAGRGRKNALREVVWFSPHCLRDDRPTQARLLEWGA